MATDLTQLLETVRASSTLPVLSADTAFELGSAIRSKFLADRAQGKFKNQGIVVSIATMTGNRLFACACGDETRIPGASNWQWVEGKTEVVRLHNRCSFFVGKSAVAAGKEPTQWAYGGGFPVWIKGCPAAAYAVIVVSGLAQADDHQLIVDVLAEFIPKMKPLE